MLENTKLSPCFDRCFSGPKRADNTKCEISFWRYNTVPATSQRPKMKQARSPTQWEAVPGEDQIGPSRAGAACGYGPAGFVARSNRKVCIHGMFSWYVFMVCIHGMYSWYVFMVCNAFMVCIHGMYSWYIFMVCIHGMYSWYYFVMTRSVKSVAGLCQPNNVQQEPSTSTTHGKKKWLEGSKLYQPRL